MHSKIARNLLQSQFGGRASFSRAFNSGRLIPFLAREIVVQRSKFPFTVAVESFVALWLVVLVGGEFGWNALFNIQYCCSMFYFRFRIFQLARHSS